MKKMKRFSREWWFWQLVTAGVIGLALLFIGALWLVVSGLIIIFEY